MHSDKDLKYEEVKATRRPLDPPYNYHLINYGEAISLRKHLPIDFYIQHGNPYDIIQSLSFARIIYCSVSSFVDIGKSTIESDVTHRLSQHESYVLRIH